MNERKRTTLEEKWAAREAETTAPEEPGRAAEDTANSDASGAELDALRAEVARLQEQLQRSQADLINFRRRTEKERGERREAERADVLGELLPVIDDFERAVAAEDAGADAVREGVELILRSLHETLDRLGLRRLEPAGEPFDPNLHEAVERQETEEVPEGHVVAVYKPGYVLGERLVRPAMVAVAAAVAEEPTGGSNGHEG